MVDFVSLYVQLPVLLLMVLLRKVIWRPPFLRLKDIDLKRKVQVKGTVF